MVFRHPAGIYRIKNLRSETYMSCTAEDPTIVHGWTSRPDSDYQQWELKPTGSRNYLRNVGSGKYLSITSIDLGNRVGASDTPTPWNFSELESTGTWYIAAESSEAIVDLFYGNNENGVSISLQPKNDHEYHRRWRLKRVSESIMERTQSSRRSNGRELVAGPQYGRFSGIIPLGTYMIVNVSSGTPLCTDTAAPSAWVFLSGSHGYIMKNKITGTYLGYDLVNLERQEARITLGTEPFEWVVTCAEGGYRIHPALHQTLFIEAYQSLWVSRVGGNERQIWRFEVASS